MKYTSFVICLLCLSMFACKKGRHEPPPPTSEGSVFTNISDPRIAEVVDSGDLITFYGVKDATGIANKLTGYKIQSLTDTSKKDFITLDDNSRYSEILLRTGERIRFTYTQMDSVIIHILSATDTLTVLKTKLVNNVASLKKLAAVTTPPFNSSIIVKVTALNSDNVEFNVDNSMVDIRMIGQDFDYEMQGAPNGNGLYSVPIPGNLLSSDPAIISKTLTFLSNVLSVACYSCDGNCPSLASAFAGFCAVPTPATEVLCAAAPAVLFACKYKVGKAIDLLNKLKDKINDYNVPPNAAILVYSKSIEYGLQYATGLALSEVKTNKVLNPTNGYDFKITFHTNSIVGTWGLFTFIWDQSGTGTRTIVFNADHTFSSAPAEQGVWTQSEQKVTFTYSYLNQYRGVISSPTFMSGTMRAAGGETGHWTIQK